MSDLMREVQYGIPQFGVLIPSGFERVAISDAMYADAERTWREGVDDAERLESVLGHLASVRRQHERMRAFGMVMPRRDSESPLPLSIVFSELPVRGGKQADDELRVLARQGARFVDDDRRMPRLEDLERTDVDGEALVVRTRSHFIPVPDTDGKKVLVLTAAVTESAGGLRVDEAGRDALWEVADAVAASFTWLDRAPAEVSADVLDPAAAPANPTSD